MATTLAIIIGGDLMKASHASRADWLFSDEYDRCYYDALDDAPMGDHFQHVVEAYMHAVETAFEKHALEAEQPEET